MGRILVDASHALRIGGVYHVVEQVISGIVHFRADPSVAVFLLGLDRRGVIVEHI